MTVLAGLDKLTKNDSGAEPASPSTIDALLIEMFGSVAAAPAGPGLTTDVKPMSKAIDDTHATAPLHARVLAN